MGRSVLGREAEAALHLPAAVPSDPNRIRLTRYFSDWLQNGETPMQRIFKNKIKSKFPSAMVFTEKYIELGKNIRQTLLFFDLAAKGNNYSIAKKLISSVNFNESFETELTYIKHE